jgi:hypothetical protein
MAFTQHGNQEYVFGFDDADATTLATTIGLKPQTLSLQYEPEFTAEAQDENGEVAAVVVGQDKVNFTMTGYIVDQAALEAATDFEFGGRFFIITGRKLDTSNTEFKKGEVSGMSYAGIVAPTP